MNGCIIDNGRRGQQYSHHHYTAIRFAIRMITFGPITVKYPNCRKTLSTVDASNHFVRCPRLEKEAGLVQKLIENIDSYLSELQQNTVL